MPLSIDCEAGAAPADTPPPARVDGACQLAACDSQGLPRTANRQTETQKQREERAGSGNSGRLISERECVQCADAAQTLPLGLRTSAWRLQESARKSPYEASVRVCEKEARIAPAQTMSWRCSSRSRPAGRAIACQSASLLRTCAKLLRMRRKLTRRVTRTLRGSREPTARDSPWRPLHALAEHLCGLADLVRKLAIHEANAQRSKGP